MKQKIDKGSPKVSRKDDSALFSNEWGFTADELRKEIGTADEAAVLATQPPSEKKVETSSYPVNTR